MTALNIPGKRSSFFPLMTSLAAIGLLTFLTGLVYFIGIALECEFPYVHTLSRASKAVDPNGHVVKERIESEFGVSKWHTCSYCSALSSQRRYDLIRVFTPKDSEPLNLFFDKESSTLMPATKRTLDKLPWLRPEQIQLVESKWRLGSGDEILSPAPVGAK